ncbi:MAG: DNA primase [Desulfovibrionaceae bacterium]|nr:DNA primase [Desulfovibrionaceae bacterium]
MDRNEAVRAIKARLGIVSLVSRYVDLKRNGSRWIAPCPFHQETKPSFSVNEEWGSFYCFGCQAKGDIFDFYSRINGVDFRTALQNLAQEVGITIDRYAGSEHYEREKKERSLKQIMLTMYDFAAGFFTSQLQGSEGAKCREYIAKRGLSPEIVQQFGLGWATPSWESLRQALQKAQYPLDIAVKSGLLGLGRNNFPYDRFRSRLIFPIKTFPKQVIAFGGRIIEQVEEAKYINSSDSLIYKKGEHLYGLVEASPGIRSKGFALLTEGYMDVLTLHQYGYTNAVGVLGTSLTLEQIERLTKGFTSKIVLLFDGDKAGRKAAVRACEMILPKGLECLVVLLPEPEDIDSLLRLPNGQAIFDDLLAHALPGIDFLANHWRTLAPREMIEQTQNFLKKIAIPELFSLMVSRLASRLGLSEEELRGGLAKWRSRLMPARKAQPKSSLPMVEGRYTLLESQILMFAVRFPEQVDLLLDLGADRALRTPAAREFWEKLQDRDTFKSCLNPVESKLVNQWCGFEAPPIEDGFESEYVALKRSMSLFEATEEQELMAETWRMHLGDASSAERNYLQSLQQTLMEHKKHEQS